LFLLTKQTSPKPVKQDVNGSVILPHLVFPGQREDCCKVLAWALSWPNRSWWCTVRNEEKKFYNIGICSPISSSGSFALVRLNFFLP